MEGFVNPMKVFKDKRVIAGLVLVFFAIGFWLWKTQYSKPQEITRAGFLELLEKRELKEGKLTPTTYGGIYKIEGVRENADGVKQPFTITTRLEEKQLKTIMDTSQLRVEVPASGKTHWLNLVSTLLICGLIIAIIFYQTNLGRGKNARRVQERPSVRFSDVAGIEEAKSEVQELVDFLKNPAKYRKLGASIPKGVLLIGPPGTGKTMLAKAIAGEAQAAFFSAHGSDFNEMFVGVGAKRVRELFRQATRSAPAIIFIDEIDCLGKNRKHDTHGELQQTNNALLAAMDGFEGSEGIVVIAATNRPEDLDDALLRPGRFDRKVMVPYPDMKGRQAILRTHTRNKPIKDPETALALIAQTTPGMSGADLAAILNEAAIQSARDEFSEIELSQLEEARDKIRFGKERRSMVVNSKEREMVAYHEAGHAIINLRMKLLPALYKVSIIPRGSALGVTTLLPTEDQNIHTRDFLLEELVVLMGGRAAEKVFYSTTTNGANGDLSTAKRIASKMIYDWGMGQKLFYEAEKRDAELEINRLMETADREAHDLILNFKSETELLARELLKRETLTRQEVLDLLKWTDAHSLAA
jgi:cell division protease FtsH